MKIKTFRISRTSLCGDEKPCDEAYRGTRECWDYRTFETPEEHDERLVDSSRLTRPWLEEGINHGTWERGIKRQLDDQEVWLIDIDSFEDFYAKYGDFIVRRPFGVNREGTELEIEIYDGYRE